MSNSILNDTKKALGLEPEYDAFDTDIIMHINTAFGTLNQLGLGPITGFMIESHEATWGDFLGEDKNLLPVKSYVYLRVRLLFDPPTMGHHVTSLNEQRKELEWRLSAYREEQAYPELDLADDRLPPLIVP